MTVLFPLCPPTIENEGNTRKVPIPPTSQRPPPGVMPFPLQHLPNLSSTHPSMFKHADNFSLQRNHSCYIYFFKTISYLNLIVLPQSYSGRRFNTPSHCTHSLRSYSLCCLLSYLYIIFPLYLPALLSSSVWPSLQPCSPQRRNFFTHTHSTPSFQTSWFS